MLHLRLSVNPGQADDLAQALVATGGVHRLARSISEGRSDEVTLAGDVAPAAADEVVAIVRERLGEDAYVLTRQDVITPSSARGGLLGEGKGFAWIEVAGEARAYSRPPLAYLGLMGAAGAIAGIGVIADNPIAIVGAMAISPDLLPICATCVGLVGGRYAMARGALLTLAAGLLLTAGVAAVLTILLILVDVLSGGLKLSGQDLGPLTNVDYTTVVIAFAAGVAGMIAFSTKASAAVGVAISVTTIPASAYLGVAFGLGEANDAAGAAIVLGTNVVLLLLGGALTLAVLRRLGVRRNLSRTSTFQVRQDAVR